MSLLGITIIGLSICGCGPNDDKGPMDQEYSHKEGAVDSTRIPGFDSSNASDSLNAADSAHTSH